MGTLRIVDVFDTAFNNQKFICVVLYNEKQRCLVKIYKKFSDELLVDLKELLYEDVTNFVSPRIKKDGTTCLDINVS